MRADKLTWGTKIDADGDDVIVESVWKRIDTGPDNQADPDEVIVEGRLHRNGEFWRRTMSAGHEFEVTGAADVATED